MLSRVLLFGMVVLVFSKILVRGKLREIGKRLNRAIDILLITILVVYAVQGVLMLAAP